MFLREKRIGSYSYVYLVVREESGSAYGTGLNGAAQVFYFAGKLGFLPGFLAFWISDLSGS